MGGGKSTGRSRKKGPAPQGPRGAAPKASSRSTALPSGPSAARSSRPQATPQPPAGREWVRLAVAPVPEQYAFDGMGYLRTYYLMKQGTGYHDAFARAQAEDSRHDETFLTSPFNFREPLLFEVWRVLPGSGGDALLDWFLVWSLVLLVVVYMLAASLTEPGAALLGPVLLIPFLFFFWWAGTWFTFAELWAAPLGVAAVACLVRRWRIEGLVLLVAAVAVREFMVVLVPAWLLAWGFSDRGRYRSTWWVPAVAVFGPAAVLLLHVVLVPPLSAGGSGISTWLHGGLPRLLSALRFGWELTPGTSWVPLVAAAAAIAAAALARPPWRLAALLAATVLPTLLLLVVSADEWDYYHGAFYVPLAVALAPGVLGRLLPPSSAEPSDASG